MRPLAKSGRYGNVNHMDRQQALIFGTDGSCLRNPNGPTGWAYACQDGSYSFGGRAVGTNQIGELMAILTVLRDFQHHPLQIESDSAYAIGCASTWKAGWQRAGYVRKTGPIANLDIIREIHRLIDGRGHPVGFIKVKAHLLDESVHPLNVRADELAGRGARAAQAGRGDVRQTGTWPIAQDLPGSIDTPSTSPVEDVPVFGAAGAGSLRSAILDGRLPNSQSGFLF